MIHYDLHSHTFQCPNDLVNKYKLSTPLHIEEACYLLSQNKAKVFIEENPQSIPSLYSYHPDSMDYFLVYLFLRKQGYLIKRHKDFFQVFKNNQTYYDRQVYMTVQVKSVDERIDLEHVPIGGKSVVAVVDGGEVSLIEIKQTV